MSQSADSVPLCEETRPERLNTAAEQLRLASTALAALANLVEEDDEGLDSHIARLEHRATELMRTARRLARDMGVAERWGLDILFAPPLTAVPARRPRSDDTIDLEPLELLRPLEKAEAPPRTVSRTTPPWAAQVVLPTPPVKIASALAPRPADESLC